MGPKDIKEERIDTIMGQGCDFDGKLSVRGSMRIDGRVKGKLSVQGTLFIGKTGFFDGEIRAKNAVVGGNLKGKVNIDEKIEFETGARFSGDLLCKGLIVNDGVIFDGNCNMSQQPPRKVPGEVANDNNKEKAH